MRLLVQAHEMQEYPMDHSAEVVYLRASSVVHEWMRFFPQGKYLHEAYLFAGICYEVLHSVNLGELHEMYYEACIKQSPHTETARNCFRRYEQSIYLGYTGTSGTHLPAEVIRKSRILEEVAQPLPVIQK
jgi:hypothetical protein